ncbi:hypothetical protein B0T19DRAFT_439448 [Cercophora scortea]|uniref:Transglycosylase SLT domain-containing protein n=1 Tax=Cercophora scortea TaxID=314031 RepID=A0AAE0MI88_9PEZI|nr:hypothetical protein B0T19DRAFT_439448 [Cercophora scortea]
MASMYREMWYKFIALLLLANLSHSYVVTLPESSSLSAPLPNNQTDSALVKRGFTWHSGPASQFPPMSQWKTYEQIFNINKPAMLSTGNTGEDVGRIWNAVLECAKIGVEERVIFAIVMQESGGDVGAPTTYNKDGRATAGLMQADGSAGFPGQHGLSQAQITSMITTGTNHYKDNLKQFGNADTADTIYKALRAYNSGSVNQNNLSDGLGATDGYVSDIANRLLGRTR